MITKSVIFLLILAFILKIFSSLSIAMGYNANPLYNYSSYSIFQEPDNCIYMETSIAAFVKERRRMFNLTQVDLAEKSGVGLRFVRELEQGKETLRIDKINQVLALFGHEVGAVPQHLNSSISQHHNI